MWQTIPYPDLPDDFPSPVRLKRCDLVSSALDPAFYQPFADFRLESRPTVYAFRLYPIITHDFTTISLTTLLLIVFYGNFGMPIYLNRAFYVFLATLVAFVLLTLTTISMPLVSTLSFLHSSQANGVSFGMWGWCLDDGMTCSPIQFGYTWPPEITASITKAFVFYPIAIVLTFFTMVAAVPIVYARSARSDKVFDVFAWVSFGTSATAFFFMIGICGVAKSRFEKRGFSASYGSLPWMSLVATVLLFIVSFRRYYLAPPPKQSHRRSMVADIESRLSAMIPERWSKGKKDISVLVEKV